MAERPEPEPTAKPRRKAKGKKSNDDEKPGIRLLRLLSPDLPSDFQGNDPDVNLDEELFSDENIATIDTELPQESEMPAQASDEEMGSNSSLSPFASQSLWEAELSIHHVTEDSGPVAKTSKTNSKESRPILKMQKVSPRSTLLQKNTRNQSLGPALVPELQV
ncbi:hypothetical protein PoHVEF18_008031 [Penicillium ochrochloron]